MMPESNACAVEKKIYIYIYLINLAFLIPSAQLLVTVIIYWSIDLNTEDKSLKNWDWKVEKIFIYILDLY